MKILIFQYWYDKYGGIESVNDTLAKEFSKQSDVTLLSLYKSKDSKILDKIYNNQYVFIENLRPSIKKCIQELKKLNFKYVIKDTLKLVKHYIQKLKCKKSVRKEFKKISPDKVIVSSIELVKYVPKEYRKKTYLHMHSSVDYFYNEKNYFKILKKYNNKISKVIWLTKAFMQEAKKLGINNSDYVYNPVRFKSDKKSKLNQKEIIYVGRIAKEKRVDLLISIFNEFNKTYPDWKLKIIGDIPNDFEYEKSKNISFLGRKEDVKEYLINSNLIALTSIYEGFPMSLLEAFECGVPAIVFDFGSSVNEVLDSGKNGFIIEQDNKSSYKEKLELYAKNLELQQEMGKNVKEFSNKFYPKIVVKKWYELFGEKYEKN